MTDYFLNDKKTREETVKYIRLLLEEVNKKIILNYFKNLNSNDISTKSSVDEKWKGIGVRIEDNILVTDKGNENLTESAPVDPKEIEALMSS